MQEGEPAKEFKRLAPASPCPDPAGIADDIPASHGWRQLKKRITILSMADLQAAMPFIEAAYRARP
jgi:hypothetical protein